MGVAADAGGLQAGFLERREHLVAIHAAHRFHAFEPGLLHDAELFEHRPFTPMVEYMIALRSLRFGAAEADGRQSALPPQRPVVILRNDRRFMRKVHAGLPDYGDVCVNLVFPCHGLAITPSRYRPSPCDTPGRLMNGAASGAFVARRFW